MKNIALLCSLFLCTQLLSSHSPSTTRDLNEFYEMYQIIKNDEGKVSSVRLKKFRAKFSVKAYLNDILSDLRAEQNHLINKNNKPLHENIEETLNTYFPLSEDKIMSDEEDELRDQMREGLESIAQINIDELQSRLSVQEFWSEFEKKVNDGLRAIDIRTLAAPQAPKFFWTKKVITEAIEWGLKGAQRLFPHSNLINIATFIVMRSHDFITTQRIKAQYRLLYYFERLNAQQLNISQEDYNQILSSVYEYRIPVTNLNESRRAAQVWNSYGMNNFLSTIRNSERRASDIAQSTRNLTNLEERLSYAFAKYKVVKNDETSFRIYHLQVASHTFTKKPALAFDSARPKFVKRKRGLIRVLQIGVGLIPRVPNWIKAPVRRFLDSMYREQSLVEAALVRTKL